MIARYLLAPGDLSYSFVVNTLCLIPIVGPIFRFAAEVIRIPSTIAGALLNSTSQMCEYQADAYAAKLLGTTGLVDVLDDMTHRDEWLGGSIGEHLTRSHPPSELRHDRVSGMSS